MYTLYYTKRMVWAAAARVCSKVLLPSWRCMQMTRSRSCRSRVELLTCFLGGWTELKARSIQSSGFGAQDFYWVRIYVFFFQLRWSKANVLNYYLGLLRSAIDHFCHTRGFCRRGVLSWGVCRTLKYHSGGKQWVKISRRMCVTVGPYSITNLQR